MRFVSPGRADVLGVEVVRDQDVGILLLDDLADAVAGGLADATWTLVPKNEWDVAAGVALIRAAGGLVEVLDEPRRPFNRENPWMAGLVAYPPTLGGEIRNLLELQAAGRGPAKDLIRKD